MSARRIIARAIMRRLRRDRRGAVLVEMAFTVPLLVLLGFGGIEIANLVLVHTRVSQIALGAADNASRIATGDSLSQPIIREIDINEVFSGVEKQARNMDFERRGRVILSSLERNTDGGQWIHWQRCYGDLGVQSSFGAAGDGATGNAFPGMGPTGKEVTAAAGTAVMFVEVYYDYQPLLYGKWLGSQRIHTTAAFNVREARDLREGFNPTPTGTVASCT
ncbi:MULTISPECIES: pilus assembly protein [unclassified Sphingopyxis]|uniref:TadE/TadG family type IV pilus assembly protein n=1 Tax=unclassified Sphingopyxis TaxID=2614943 RepID=UPI0024AC8AB1|nr:MULTISPECIES: pilus assembly protein [unclassified Sphingopyxis]